MQVVDETAENSNNEMQEAEQFVINSMESCAELQDEKRKHLNAQEKMMAENSKLLKKNKELHHSKQMMSEALDEMMVILNADVQRFYSLRTDASEYRKAFRNTEAHIGSMENRLRNATRKRDAMSMLYLIEV